MFAEIHLAYSWSVRQCRCRPFAVFGRGHDQKNPKNRTRPETSKRKTSQLTQTGVSTNNAKHCSAHIRRGQQQMASEIRRGPKSRLIDSLRDVWRMNSAEKTSNKLLARVCIAQRQCNEPRRTNASSACAERLAAELRVCVRSSAAVIRVI